MMRKYGLQDFITKTDVDELMAASTTMPPACDPSNSSPRLPKIYDDSVAGSEDDRTP